jgi:DNA-binding transcriptional LysR family regulator
MELNWLEDFIALAETRNFSRAAELRNITQPAFSRRVRALEDWVGTPLFERGAGGVDLTPAGKQFRHGAEDLVRRILHLRHEAREAGGQEAATLRFAATHALSFTFFPEWIRGAGALAGPVRLMSDSMQACEDLMLHGQAQFVLCHVHAQAPNRFAPDQFRSRVVGGDALVPLVAPDDTGAPKWRLSAGAADLPYLAYSAESGLGRIVQAHRFGDRATGLRPVFSAHLAASLLGMARDGWGIAWLPLSLAERELADGRLLRAGDTEWEVPVEIRLFRPAARQSPTAEAFWKQVSEAVVL